MAANPTIADLNSIPDAQQIVAENSAPKPTSPLGRSEEVLRKAFGGDEQTIANSLRGL